MRHSLLALAVTLVVAGCGDDAPPAAEPAPPQGRAETRSIRNTEAVGYPGDAIADKVDGALDQSEERAKKTDAASQEN